MRNRPGVVSGAQSPSHLSLPARRGSGAPEGASLSVTPLSKACTHLAIGASASRRSTAAFPGGCSRGSRRPTPAALPGTWTTCPVPVQRAPRRASIVMPGRSPGPPECEVTSLARGTPHPAPPSKRLATTPSDEQGGMYLYSYRNKVNRNLQVICGFPGCDFAHFKDGCSGRKVASRILLVPPNRKKPAT